MHPAVDPHCVCVLDCPLAGLVQARMGALFVSCAPDLCLSDLLLSYFAFLSAHIFHLSACLEGSASVFLLEGLFASEDVFCPDIFCHSV